MSNRCCGLALKSVIRYLYSSLNHIQSTVPDSHLKAIKIPSSEILDLKS